MKRGGDGFVGFLLCGLVFWRWFDACVKRAAVSIQSNAGIINQVYLPKLIFPVVEIFISSYRFMYVLVLLLLFMAIYRQTITVYWLALPVILLVQLTLICGVGLCFSLCIPYVPDIQKILDNGMMFLFFMSGIFFDISQLSETSQKYLSLNPMAVLLQQYRCVLLADQWPDWIVMGKLSLISVSLLGLALFAGKKLDMSYPRIIR